MNGLNRRLLPLRSILVGIGLMASSALTGCQVQVGGQTLPAAYYMSDDVQYYAPGPEFELSNEAAALQAAKAEQALQSR